MGSRVTNGEVAREAFFLGCAATLGIACGDSPREEVFLTGCQANEEVICRPVDILEAPDGRLFVSDDYAGAVYTITKTP